MHDEGVARVAFGPKTLGAMLLALVVYVVASYVVMLAVTLAVGCSPPLRSGCLVIQMRR